MESLQTLLSPQQYRIFSASIRTETTRKNYAYLFQKYMQFVDGKIFKEPRELEMQIVDYLLSMKGAADSTIKTSLHAITHFYTMSDIILNKKKISKFTQFSQVRKKKNTGYNKEKIAQLISVCDKRARAVVLLLASSGMRLGGLAGLKIKDLEKIELDREENLFTYQITVYEGEQEEYTTFCTPECYNALKVYFEYRERVGEKLKPSSPVIRDAFSKQRPLSINAPRKISLRTIESLVERKAIDAGLRTKEKSENNDNRTSTTKYRKDVQIVHGFPKFFNTSMINSDVNHTFKELLMGHTIKLDDVYYDKNNQKSRIKLLDEYSKAIDYLTISEENRLRIRLKNQTIAENVQTQLEQKEEEIIRLKQELKLHNSRMDEIEEMLRKIDQKRAHIDLLVKERASSAD